MDKNQRRNERVKANLILDLMATGNPSDLWVIRNIKDNLKGKLSFYSILTTCYYVENERDKFSGKVIDGHQYLKTRLWQAGYRNTSIIANMGVSSNG